jgi:hypothetical protein|tara:strand:+ start:2370 stop:2693 length:324 start_codon:yes stop_codon:yes gene_type:complete
MKNFILIVFTFFSYNLFSQDLINNVNIELYPNPATDYITVKFQNKLNVDDFEFKIHSLIGNQLNFDSERVSDRELKIDLKNISKGIFFLIINEKNDRKRKILKFLKN